MSNHLAIAATSAALGRLLQDALDVDVPGAKVSHERPGGPGDDARRGVNIFLFQITPNAALRNLDLPTRDTGGRTVARATAALDLHYLLTCYGDVTSFEPERVMGSVVRRLHERPLLDSDLIRATLADAQNTGVIGDSDLADAPERVKFAPTPLNLEELSKLWSILFQTPYRLSTAYRGTVVQIEARVPVASGLPVRHRSGFVAPIPDAGITAVESADGRTAPILDGGRVVVTGRGFDLQGAQVTLNRIVATLDPATAARERVEIILVPASLGGARLSAGVVTARVALPPPDGAPAHLARETPAFPFLLRPSLSLAAGAVVAGPPDAEGRRDGTITVALAPPFGQGQDARLLLDRTAPRPPLSVVLEPRIPGGATFPLAQLVFPFAELSAGTWLVRLQVDGAESPLTVGTNPADPDFGTVTGPTATIP
jgi:hypothetical protein